MSDGDSQCSLVDTPGLEQGMRVRFAALPRAVARELGPLPEGVTRASALRGAFDCVHAFTAKRAELAELLPGAGARARSRAAASTSRPAP